MVSGRTTIAASGSDDIVAIEMSDVAGPVARATSAPWAIAWDTVGHNGRVGFTVTDRAGNVSEYILGPTENWVRARPRHAHRAIQSRFCG